MKHEIWIEGYLASGMDGIPAPARLLGRVDAPTFSAACDQLCSPAEWQKDNGNYNSARGTVWGCRLFGNEADARRSFG